MASRSKSQMILDRQAAAAALEKSVAARAAKAEARTHAKARAKTAKTERGSLCRAIPPRTPDALMPWGKHKGKRLDELPIRYLRWLAERATRTQGTKIALAAAAEYVWRVNQENERRVAAGLEPMPAPPTEIVRER